MATVNLDCKLDLKTIAFHARNVEYNPKVINPRGASTENRDRLLSRARRIRPRTDDVFDLFVCKH